MRVSFFTICIVTIFCQSSFAIAELNRTIEVACANKATQGSDKQSELSKKIEKMLLDYKTQDQRVKNRTQFVATLDQIIAGSEFSYLLKCRDDLNNTKDFSYELIFQNLRNGNDSMAINPIYSAPRADGSFSTHIQLEFNLVKAANSGKSSTYPT
jgi:hypothetical protein